MERESFTAQIPPAPLFLCMLCNPVPSSEVLRKPAKVVRQDKSIAGLGRLVEEKRKIVKSSAVEKQQL
jgi:hypothetical protein